MNRTRMTTAAAALAFLGVLATPALASAELPGDAAADRLDSGMSDGLPLVGDLLGGTGGLTGGLPLVGGLGL
jgi:hypothetical protein